MTPVHGICMVPVPVARFALEALAAHERPGCIILGKTVHVQPLGTPWPSQENCGS